MKRFIYIFVIFACLALCGCEIFADNPNIYGGNGISLSKNEIEPVSMTGYTKSEYSLNILEKNVSLGRAEPENGCYVGAYVLSNENIERDIGRFDQLTEKSHAITVYNMRLGDEFPLQWLLECASTMKTAYFIVKPPNDYNFFSEEALERAAKDFGELAVPIFVDFYPNPQSYGVEPYDYIYFYRKARSRFDELAPNVIFVASVDSKNVYDYGLYYPGDSYCDWMGISLYRPLYQGGVPNTRNYWKDIDFFYQLFQHEKPIIISQLAFSSYSTADHRYASQEGAKRLAELYGKIKDDYPRVKAINYMDFNNITGAPQNAERDNFSITQDETMLKAYREAVKDDYFLSETAVSGDKKTSAQTFKSFYAVYEDENFKYISKNALVSEGIQLLEANAVIINGEEYYGTDELANLLNTQGASLIIEPDKKRIIVEKGQKN